MSEEQKESRVPFTVYLSQGKQLALKGDNERAIERYTIGLENKEDDLNLLLDRSKCYLRMGNTVAALNDAETTLQVNKTFLKGLLQKADVLYAMGEFEMALVCFHSGQRIRPELDDFRLGIQKVHETIDNSLGSLSPFRRKNEGKAQIHEIQDKGGNADKDNNENNEHIHRKLLEEFYVDRVFLNNLLKNKVLHQDKPKQSLKVAQKVMCFVKRMSDSELPTRNEVLANLHNCIGNALLRLGCIDEAMENHEAELTLAVEYNLEEYRSRALDHISHIYAKTGRFAQAVEVLQERLSFMCSALDSIWLHHELGRCYLELKNFSEARNHGHLSLNEAQKAQDSEWLLNAVVLMANIDMKLEDYHSAILNFELSLNEARALKNNEAEEGILKSLKKAKYALSLKCKDPSGSNQQGNEAHGMDISLGITEKDEENDDINTVPKQQINQEANPVVDASSSSIEDKV
uniref:Outer dynein arm-docking complex subunit 4 n=1 Tax=Eptatretus burgeri TaxID=7764 RepID=A0A8C4NEF3_EPTBU